jgi:hypothetical protein
MAHSYISCLYHCVFSTKERRQFITPELEERLWPTWAESHETTA